MAVGNGRAVVYLALAGSALRHQPGTVRLAEVVRLARARIGQYAPRTAYVKGASLIDWRPFFGVAAGRF